MAEIYWRRRHGGAVYEIEDFLKVFSTNSHAYWNEVIMYLLIKKNGKKGIH